MGDDDDDGDDDGDVGDDGDDDDEGLPDSIGSGELILYYKCKHKNILLLIDEFGN